MKKFSFSSSARYLKIIAALAALAISLAGCMNTGQKTSPSGDGSGTAAANGTEKMYRATIDGYLNELLAEPKGIEASLEVQTKYVEKMVQLYNQNGASKDIHTLYVEGISKLSTTQADKFTVYAIAGLMRNSAIDYTNIEKYSNNPEFFEKFRKEAAAVNLKYVILNKNLENIKDPEVKKIVQDAKNQGYFVTSSEGMLYYQVDFTEFARYRKNNTQPMASLIESMAIDSLDPLTSDAAFIVNGANLAARTYAIEKMLKDYNGTQYEKYLAVRFKDHMTMIFFGVNNTPNFSYETNLINENVLPLFKDIQNLDGTFMEKLVTEFRTLLEASGCKLDDSTREKAKDILKTINVKYGLTEKNETDYRQWMAGNLVVDMKLK